MTLHVNQHLHHILPKDVEAQKIPVIGTISSVVEAQKKAKVHFTLDVSHVYNKDAAWNLPAKIHLTWNHPKRLQPGDKWKLTVKLRRPRNYANPGSFDLEKYYFQQRISAVGYVVENAENELLARDFMVSPINNLRQSIYYFIQQHIADQSLASVIAALILGVKANLADEQMEILQNTGTGHLLAISGLHLGIIAGICMLLLRFVWRFTPMARTVSAPWFAACGALIICIFYALLAGMSIATQRAIIMLSVLLWGTLSKRKVSSTQIFCLALLLVLLWDPFAILALGFWYSFLIVGLLLYAFRGQRNTGIQQFIKPQIVITLGLLPLSLLFFPQTSLIAPLANILAIPWVGFAVLPCCLIAVSLLPFMPELSALLLKCAAYNLELLWTLLEKLAVFPILTWRIPEQDLGLILLAAFLGTFCLLLPRGLPGRWWGVFGFLPLIFVHSTPIPYGQADFTLLDVGQGLATVIRTQNHVLVYDTGAKLPSDFDLGARVVAPYLQGIGIKKIDTLMISHGDNDHVGGAPGLLHKIHAKKIITSEAQTLSEYRPELCVAGQQWEWDGVQFSVLHPQSGEFIKKRNDRSCVLMIHAGKHKALLTGDIEKKSEQQLIDLYGDELQADLMLVPHHGSKTSSSIEFIQNVQPKYALIPVGYKNQYGHPKEQVLQRYADQQISILRTENDGAISIRLGASGLIPTCFRQLNKAFWHN